MLDFIVYEVGGSNDGAEIGRFENLTDARCFADHYEKDHADDLNPTWGGTMILDAAGVLWY